MVNMENYEEYLLLHADGELSEADEKALDAFLDEHPELRHEQELYMTTKLPADTNMVYEGKEQLLKKPGRVMVLKQWRSYAAAAGIVLAMVLVWKWQRPGQTTINIVQVNNSKTIITAPTDTVTRKQKTEEDHIASTGTREHIKEPHPPLQTNPKTHHYVNLKQENLPETEALATLDVLPVKAMPEAPVPVAPKAISVEVPRVQLPAPEAKENVSGALLARLPVKEESIGTLASAVNDKLEKVRNIKDNIKNTDLSVRLGNRELFVVRF